jgi:hypothetical protein
MSKGLRFRPMFYKRKLSERVYIVQPFRKLSLISEVSEFNLVQSQGSLGYDRLSTSLLLPNPHSLFPIPYSLLPAPYSLFPIPYSLFPTPHSPLPTPLKIPPNCRKGNKGSIKFRGITEIFLGCHPLTAAYVFTLGASPQPLFFKDKTRTIKLER